MEPVDRLVVSTRHVMVGMEKSAAVDDIVADLLPSIETTIDAKRH